MKNKIHINRGFTLVEMVIYIGILVSILLLIVSFIISFGKAYNVLKTTIHINNSAVVSFERMIREIRLASDVDMVASTLGTYPGHLVLITTDVSSAPITLEFYINSGVLILRQDSVDVGPLTRSDVTVTNLVFRLSDNGTSKAIKIEMTLESTIVSTTKSKNFYGSAVLRGSY